MLSFILLLHAIDIRRANKRIQAISENQTLIVSILKKQDSLIVYYSKKINPFHQNVFQVKK
jgi:hypothetical protein